jgi:hypothetical protein
MKARLTTSAFGVRQHDKALGSNVALQAGADATAVSVSLNKLAGADEAHKRMVSLQAAARGILYEYTSPWDAAWRLLPATSFDAMARAMASVQTEFQSALEELRAAAPDIIRRASAALGPLAARVKLPSPEELGEAYSLRVDYAPVETASAAGFPGVPRVVAERLAELMEARAKAQIADALRDTRERLSQSLQTMAARLAEYDAREDAKNADPDYKSRKGVFRDSLVSNLEDSLALASSMVNAIPGADPLLEEACARTRRLLADLRAASARLTVGSAPAPSLATVLREDAVARHAARRAAEDAAALGGDSVADIMEAFTGVAA